MFASATLEYLWFCKLKNPKLLEVFRQKLFTIYALFVEAINHCNCCEPKQLFCSKLAIDDKLLIKWHKKYVLFHIEEFEVSHMVGLIRK